MCAIGNSLAQCGIPNDGVVGKVFEKHSPFFQLDRPLQCFEVL